MEGRIEDEVNPMVSTETLLDFRKPTRTWACRIGKFRKHTQQQTSGFAICRRRSRRRHCQPGMKIPQHGRPKGPVNNDNLDDLGARNEAAEHCRDTDHVRLLSAAKSMYKYLTSDNKRRRPLGSTNGSPHACKIMQVCNDEQFTTSLDPYFQVGTVTFMSKISFSSVFSGETVGDTRKH